MQRKADKKDEDTKLLELLETGVRDVLTDKKSTPAQKLQAVTAGAKLLAIKHKISGEEDGGSGFFAK